MSTTPPGRLQRRITMFTVPVVIFFVFVHKRLTTGMVVGAVKG